MSGFDWFLAFTAGNVMGAVCMWLAHWRAEAVKDVAKMNAPASLPQVKQVPLRTYEVHWSKPGVSGLAVEVVKAHFYEWSRKRRGVLEFLGYSEVVYASFANNLVYAVFDVTDQQTPAEPKGEFTSMTITPGPSP